MHVKYIQGRSQYRNFSRKDRGKCAVQGFKLRYTGLSIDRPLQRSHVIDGPVTGLARICQIRADGSYRHMISDLADTRTRDQTRFGSFHFELGLTKDVHPDSPRRRHLFHRLSHRILHYLNYGRRWFHHCRRCYLTCYILAFRS